MAKRKTSTKSLHIQNDQTDDAGVYQRNRGADLFMEPPGGIQQFTNFNDKVASFDVRGEGAASASGFFNSPYRNSGRFKSNPNTDYGKLEFRPSDIKILDDIAIVAYRGHSQEVYLTNHVMKTSYFIFKVTYDKVGNEETFSGTDLVSGAIFEDVGTEARNLLEYVGLGGEDGTNAGVEAGYSINFSGDVADSLGIGPTTTSGSTGPCAGLVGDTWTWNNTPSEPGWTMTSPGECAAALCGSQPPAYDGTFDLETGEGRCGVPDTIHYDPFDSPDGDIKKRVNEGVDENCAGQPMPAAALKNDEEGIFFSQVKNKKGEIVDVLQGLVVDFSARSTPSDATLLSLKSRSDSNLIWVDECAEDTVTYYYKVPIEVAGYYYQLGISKHCGRVDVYERRGGFINAIAGNKITVRGPSGDGTFDTELLGDGDRIKIDGGLSDPPEDRVHPINGIKYVKRTSLDTEYYLYDDKNLTISTDTSSLRDVTGISWAHHPEDDSDLGSWRYKQTLFSPNGLNGDGVTGSNGRFLDNTPYINENGVTQLSDYSGYHGADAYTRNGMDLVPWGYMFGQSIDIVKQPPERFDEIEIPSYWLAISEVGNTYSSTGGVDYFGRYHEAQGGIPLTNTLPTFDHRGNDTNPDKNRRGISLSDALDLGLSRNTAGLSAAFINHSTGKYDKDIDWNKIEDYSYGRFEKIPNEAVQTRILSPYGYKARRPVHAGHGRVWLYKIDMYHAPDGGHTGPNGEVIGRITVDEQITANTRNPHVGPLEDNDNVYYNKDDHSDSQIGKQKTPLLCGDKSGLRIYRNLSQLENLYWYRAMISNFKQIYRPINRYPSSGAGDGHSYNCGYPRKWTPSWDEGGFSDGDSGNDFGDDMDIVGGTDLGGDSLSGGGGMGMGGGGGGGRTDLGGGFGATGTGMEGDRTLQLGDHRREGGTVAQSGLDTNLYYVTNENFSHYLDAPLSQGGGDNTQFYEDNIAPFLNFNSDPYDFPMYASLLNSRFLFADGFGFSICMKADDVTGGDRPIIAIANTVFPYLSTIGRGTDAMLSAMQKDLDKVKRSGADDPNTQDFIDRHTKSNSFIRDFIHDGVSARDKNGSIVIVNCNQQINTQVLDWTSRVSKGNPNDVNTIGNYGNKDKYSYDPYGSNESIYEYAYWYGSPPSMMFSDDSLLVGTDEGKIKVFKQESIRTDTYFEKRYPALRSELRRVVIGPGGEEYTLGPNNQLGELLGAHTDDYADENKHNSYFDVIAPYRKFSDSEKEDMDQWNFTAKDSHPRQVLDVWCSKLRADLNFKIHMPMGTDTTNVRPTNENVDPDGMGISLYGFRNIWDTSPPSSWEQETSSYHTYSTYYILPPRDVLSAPIHPTYKSSISVSDPSDRAIDEQMDSRVLGIGSTSNGIPFTATMSPLLNQPFGYSFRCDRGMLVAHGASYVNEFDITGIDIAHRLYVYELSKNGNFEFIQKITPATSSNANGSFPDFNFSGKTPKEQIAITDLYVDGFGNNTPAYVKVFSEEAMTFEEGLENSKTIAYRMEDMYDVAFGRIVLMTPYGSAVFGDTGASKDYEFFGDQVVVQSSPYFTFIEQFNSKYPYNLNDMYSYREGLGTEFPANIFDANEEHSGLCSFYNVEKISSQNNSIRVLESAKITIDVEENTTWGGEARGDDVSRVLPVVTLYQKDPRETIKQEGSVPTRFNRKLLYGSERRGNRQPTLKFPNPPANEAQKVRLDNHPPLYVDGVQDAQVFSVLPVYKRNSVAGDQGWRGEVVLSGSTLAQATSVGSLIKNSSNNKTILHNDGKGYNSVWSHDLDKSVPNSYIQTFDDINKDSFDSRINVEGTLIVGLVSHNGTDNSDTGDFDGVYRTKWDDTLVPVYADAADEDPSNALGFSTKGLNYLPYSKTFRQDNSNAHAFINKAKISSIEFTYRDYDLGKLRRFKCAFFQKNQLLDYGTSHLKTSGLLRIGESRVSTLFDVEGYTLDGTHSNSLQIVEIAQYDESYDFGSDSYAFNIVDRIADIQKPEFLSLSVFSAPTREGNFTMSTRGYVAASGLAPTYIGGVATHAEGMPLKIGSTPVVNYLGLTLPIPLGFKCDGMSFFTPTALGTKVNSPSLSVQFPGGTGVDNGMALSVGITHSASGMRLAMGQPSLGSGNMNIAMSGVYGSYNSIPCIQGNLYLSSTHVNNNNAPLNLGRLSDSGNIPLSLRTADPASGVMNLTINTEPFNSNNASYPSGLHLHQKGFAEKTANTNLYIGEQASEASAPLFLMQPHRLPFIDPQSPPTFEGDDTMQIPNLYVSGAAVPTANSLDDNFQHQKQMVRENSQFDYSSNAEAIIPYNGSNSLSRNTLIPNWTNDYGVKRISKVGSVLEDYSGLGTVSFYNNEMPRQSIDSNGTYLAVGTSSNLLRLAPPLQIFNVLTDSSVELDYSYTEFGEDLVDLGITDGPEMSFVYKDIKVSPNGRIAVSVRARFNSYFSDMIFILEIKQFNRITTSTTTFDECAIETGSRLSSKIESLERWKITSVITSDSWSSSTSNSKVLNRIMGDSISWKGEDLYYGKQSTRFGNIYVSYESDDYATENKVFGFNQTGDAAGYGRNINNMPAGTKTGFGSKIQLAGDFAFVSAPLLDPYIANNNLSAVNAASPDGAVYIFKYDSGWSYVDAIYSGGLISSAITGVDSCAYDAKLFGYDLDYDSKSGYLSVGEPMSNTVYQFNINPAGTPSLLNSYSSTDSKFGTFVNSVSAGLITNTKSKIQDVVYSQDFEFSTEEIESEVQQYISGVNVINSVSHEIVSVQKATLAGEEKLLVTRDFEVAYGAGKVKKIQKISLLGLHDINGTLYISGPGPVSEPLNLSMPIPSGGATGDLGITFGSIGTGVVMPLHLTNYIGSGAAPLHMRSELLVPPTLYMSADFTPATSGASLVTAGPIYASGTSDLNIEGKVVGDFSSSVFVLGGTETGAMAQMGVNMRLAQVDIYPASGQQDALITGIGHGTGNITGSPSLWLGAGDYGPASGTTFMRMEAPPSAEVSAFTGLSVITDPASGVFETTATLMMPNTQTIEVNPTILREAQSLHIISYVQSSGNKNLVVWREGIGGGTEAEADATLMIPSITSASGINVYMSGGHMSTGTANLTLPHVFTLPSGSPDLFIRGYSE